MSTRVVNEYEAPLLLADEPSCVPHSYFVFLHHGYSLEQHKQAVGDGADLESAIRNVFSESRHYGLHHSARLNETSLAAVRSNIGVDMVECDRKAFLISDVPVPDRDDLLIDLTLAMDELAETCCED